MLTLGSCPLDGRSGHAAGRALLEQLYGELTGQPMPQIRKTPLGKPYFPGSCLHFSISHTKNRVFCAVSDRPIGMDAEELTRKVNPKLAEKILSPGEYAQYAAAADQNLALLTFWVLKEAAAKCTGLGLQGYPNHTDFSLNDQRVMQRDGCVLAVMEEEDHVI